MKKIALFAAAAAFLAVSAPQVAIAQDEWPMERSGYVDVGMIEVADGHGLDYANHLAGQWRKGQDFAKAQGWIKDYQIWSNVNPRRGEPDFYLITWFSEFPTKAEEEARDAAYNKHMAKTLAQMNAESGERAKYRTVLGSMLLQNNTFKK